MDSTILAYIAGFLDGDGSIFFQLVKRKDYLYGYQVRSSIAFYQKSNNLKVLEGLKSILKSGYIRHRKTGISDYTIVDPGQVRNILELLKPYVLLKEEHVKLGIKILDMLRQVNCAYSFLEVCQLVDRFKEINYSKKRRVTSDDVKDFLKQHNYLTPVETDPIKERALD